MSRPASGLLAISILLVAGSSAFAAAAQPGSPGPRTLSLDLVNLPLTDVLLDLHWKSGASIVAANGGAPERITLRASNLGVEKALDMICERANCRWSKSGAYYVVTPKGVTYGGLPPIEQDENFLLYPERERLAAGRLLSALDGGQIARLGSGAQFSWADLRPAQQDMLTGLYQGLQQYLTRLGADDSLAVAARRGLLGPVEEVTFTLRTGLWSMEGTQR